MHELVGTGPDEGAIIGPVRVLVELGDVAVIDGLEHVGRQWREVPEDQGVGEAERLTPVHHHGLVVWRVDAVHASAPQGAHEQLHLRVELRPGA